MSAAGDVGECECKKKKKPCLSYRKKMTVKRVGVWKAITITNDNWWEILDEMPANELQSLYGAMRQFGVCAPGVITMFSVMALQAWSVCDGFKQIGTPKEFLALPAVWVDVVGVIKQEIGRIQKVRQMEKDFSGNKA